MLIDRRATNHLVNVSPLAGWVVFTLALQVFSVPLLASVPIAIGASRALVRRHGIVGHMVIVISISVSLGILELGSQILASPPNDYFRPHEMLDSEEHPYYEPNRRVDDFEMPYGDLYPLSDRTEATIIKPRKVWFHTDALGLRNSRDYDHQRFVLVGDSFGVGNSNSQEHTIPELLEHDYGLPTYNASWPVDPWSHARRLRELRENFDPGFELIMLIFEGNDFGECQSEKDVHSRWFAYVLESIRTESESYAVISRMFRRISDSLQITSPGSVTVWPIGNRDVGFYDLYTVVAHRSSLEGCEVEKQFADFAEFRSDIALLVFVPTKYRVYHSLLPIAQRSRLPNLQGQFLEGLAEQLQVPFLDLTPMLEKHSQLILAEDRYTFWRDDTHWSPEGMMLAASEIADALQAQTRTRAGQAKSL